MTPALRNRRTHPGARPALRNVLSVAVIGAGNWGTALALALHGAGVPVSEIVVRRRSRTTSQLARAIGARIATLDRAELSADVIWICTPDGAISGLAAEIAVRMRTIRAVPAIVFHSSGALAAAELAALRTVKASVASVHPLMTFPRTPNLQPMRTSKPLAGVPFAIEGDPRALRTARILVHALRGDAFTLPPAKKPIYHAFGAFTSPLLVALLTAAEQAASAAGWSPQQARRRMRPIVERTIANFFADGPANSFSGPIPRGDAATVARHLQALHSHPSLASVYRELSLFALDALPAANAAHLRRLLNRSEK